MMWAAGDMVNFVEFKEVMELPGSVAWTIVFFNTNGHPNLEKNIPSSMVTECVEVFGIFLTSRNLLITNHKVVDLVPVEEISSKGVPCMWWNFTDISNWFDRSGS